MKNTFYLVLGFVLIFTSCQTKKEPAPVNAETVKMEVTKMLNDMNAVLKTKDVKSLMTFYTDDAVFCGTDPSEILDKPAYEKTMNTMLTESKSMFDFKIDIVVVQVDKRGESAIVVRQFIPDWSSPLPVRETLHLIKQDQKWLINFSDFALIPLNKDIPAIRAAAGK